MRIAKDGKEFDVDNLGELDPDELEAIQYLRPDGRRRRMAFKTTNEIVGMAKNMVLSAEELGTGKVAVYCRFCDESDEDEEIGIADNEPGDNSPTKVMERLIISKDKQKNERKDNHE